MYDEKYMAHRYSSALGTNFSPCLAIFKNLVGMGQNILATNNLKFHPSDCFLYEESTVF